jgi:galactofuranosylgalactofuranosylrhamnosyl-N-acetylglucosaminyl-diphospho-decaprenol beta-1,5/1,6-galactofuranosyltransferase
MSVPDKDDTTDWQAYFYLRNRLVGAALHGSENQAMVFAASLRSAVRHGLAMQYSILALQEMAIRDFLAGPEMLFEKLPTALGEVRARLAAFTDGQVLDSRELPLPAGGRLAVERLLIPPPNPIAVGATLFKRLAHQLHPADRQARQRPQFNLARQDAQWSVLSEMNGGTASTADGHGVTYRKRDLKVFRSLMARSIALHRELAREFPRLRKRYRAAAEELTSRSAWKQVFDA